MKKIGILFCSLLAITACTDNSAETIQQLKGKWNAITLVESDSIINNDPKSIAFTFHNDKEYSYQGGPTYQESGNYRIKGSIFYSTDTLAAQRIEKAVKIAQLTKDSLTLEMNDGGIKKELILVKE